MKKLTIVAILTTGLFSPAAWSGNFTVGVEANDYLPIFNGQDSEYSGYARDLLDSFASKYGHRFTYSPLPVARLFNEFAVKKSLDLKFPDTPYWANDVKKNVKVVYSKSAVLVTDGLLVLPQNKGKGSVTSIVTIRGFTPYPYLEQINIKQISLREENTPTAAINVAAAGRADGVYLGMVVANHLMIDVIKKPGILVFDDKLPNMKSEYSLSSINHPELIKQFDEYLVKEKDTVAKLKAKYQIVE